MEVWNPESEDSKFLLSFIEGKELFVSNFWSQIITLTPPRIRSSSPVLERVERLAFAVMLKHFFLIEEAKESCKKISEKLVISEDSKKKWKFLGEKTKQLVLWISQRAQWEKQWQNAILECLEKKEKENIFSIQIEEIKENGFLKNICEIKNISISEKFEEKEIMNLLELKLKVEVENSKKKENVSEIPNATELISKSIIGRLEFLLFQIFPCFPNSDVASYLWNFEEKEKIQNKKLNQTSFQSWKVWNLNSLDNQLNPIQAIFSFLKSNFHENFSLIEFLNFLKFQNLNSKFRFYGFEFFSKLLKISPKAPILHQILGSINFQSRHYLVNIPACGRGKKFFVCFSFSFFSSFMLTAS